MYVQTDHLIASNCSVTVSVTCLFVLENKGLTASWRSTPPQGTPSSVLHGQLRETFPASDVGGSSVCQSGSSDLWPHLHSSWLPVGLVDFRVDTLRKTNDRQKKKTETNSEFFSCSCHVRLVSKETALFSDRSILMLFSVVRLIRASYREDYLPRSDHSRMLFFWTGVEIIM